MSELNNLYLNHFYDVFNFVHSRIKNFHIAQEIVHDTFVRACENIHVIQILNNEKKQAWLMTVARNLCIDHWRVSRKSALNMAFDSNDEHSQMNLLESDQEKLMDEDSKELIDFLYEIIKKLKSEHQKAIYLFYVEELSYKECSNVLKITEVAFASLLKRARKALLNEVLKVYSPHITKVPFREKEQKMLLYWFGILDFPTNIEEVMASKIRNFFNGFSQNFDEFRKCTYPENLDEYLMSTVNLNKDAIVADFGCGLGSLTLKLSPKVATVVAIDHSVEMLKTLKESAERDGFNNIKPVSLDISSDLTTFYQTFNVAFCCMVLHHVLDPKSVLKEMAQTLVSGGHLIIADLSFTDKNWILKDAHDLWSGFKESQMREWIEKAGLTIIHIEVNQSKSFNFYDKKSQDQRVDVPLLFVHCVKQD